jgi:hypothetical protein
MENVMIYHYNPDAPHGAWSLFFGLIFALIVSSCATKNMDFVDSMNYRPGPDNSNIATSMFMSPDNINR